MSTTEFVLNKYIFFFLISTLTSRRFRTPRAVLETQSPAVSVELEVFVALVQHGRPVIRHVGHQVELAVVNALRSAAVDV